ncbi:MULTISPECIES: hypothetical protein [Bacillus]|uniref:hypothetical protein n=1 Tax=Bacillus TaxID=1386 RepID=UPI000D03B209|nr:hypothetical protein [Bacillus sp. NMCC4]PRS35696.1 hypothetical protein C6Y02_16925 [Bacillus sp. NMCC4]
MELSLRDYFCIRKKHFDFERLQKVLCFEKTTTVDHLVKSHDFDQDFVYSQLKELSRLGEIRVERGIIKKVNKNEKQRRDRIKVNIITAFGACGFFFFIAIFPALVEVFF